MPVSFRWFDSDKTILILDISGRWTWDELFQAYDQNLADIQQTRHTVYVLMLRAQDEFKHYVPPNAIVHSISMIRRLPSNIGMGIIVDSDSRILRAIHDAIARLYQPYGHKVAMVATMDEAMAQIEAAKRRELQD
jgi:hypothetical protein